MWTSTQHVKLVIISPLWHDRAKGKFDEISSNEFLSALPAALDIYKGQCV